MFFLLFYQILLCDEVFSFSTNIFFKLMNYFNHISIYLFIHDTTDFIVFENVTYVSINISTVCYFVFQWTSPSAVTTPIFLFESSILLLSSSFSSIFSSLLLFVNSYFYLSFLYSFFLFLLFLILFLFLFLRVKLVLVYQLMMTVSLISSLVTIMTLSSLLRTSTYTTAITLLTLTCNLISSSVCFYVFAFVFVFVFLFVHVHISVCVSKDMCVCFYILYKYVYVCLSLSLYLSSLIILFTLVFLCDVTDIFKMASLLFSFFYVFFS